jgi:mono/diheme cytochrome c family protein
VQRFFKYLILAFVFTCFTLAIVAQSGKQPPFDLTDQARIDAGKTTFNSLCAGYCHGDEGSGGRTPAFKGNSNLKTDQVFQVITDGLSGEAGVMPAFGSMPVEKRWELVAYIMYLSHQPADASHD